MFHKIGLGDAGVAVDDHCNGYEFDDDDDDHNRTVFKHVSELSLF